MGVVHGVRDQTNPSVIQVESPSGSGGSGGSVDLSSYYNKTEIDGRLETLLEGVNNDVGDVEADLSTVTGRVSALETSMSSAETDITSLSSTTTTLTNTVADKADLVDVYTRTEVGTMLGAKADSATTYTKAEVDSLTSEIKSTYFVTFPGIKGTNNIWQRSPNSGYPLPPLVWPWTSKTVLRFAGFAIDWDAGIRDHHNRRLQLVVRFHILQEDGTVGHTLHEEDLNLLTPAAQLADSYSYFLTNEIKVSEVVDISRIRGIDIALKSPGGRFGGNESALTIHICEPQ